MAAAEVLGSTELLSLIASCRPELLKVIRLVSADGRLAADRVAVEVAADARAELNHALRSLPSVDVPGILQDQSLYDMSEYGYDDDVPGHLWNDFDRACDIASARLLD
jgi:hypothetical protein